uniref:Transmembrane protein 243, mitochondrial a n=1 Tax=Esox lucius TaxID=8010 RepID=A0AAY5KGM0_ESOLU
MTSLLMTSPPEHMAPVALTTDLSLEKPLHGAINLLVGGLTSLLVVVTVISSFLFPSLPPWPLNIFFAFCILMTCGSVMVLIAWYRQGDLDPKFRKLIYYMLASIILLCLCANLYFHRVDSGT